ESATDTPEHAATQRRIGVTDAITSLAPSASVQLLGLPGDDLAGHLPEVLTAITAAITTPGPRTWVLAPWRYDGQPDHTVAGHAAQAAAHDAGARLIEYPIWAWHWSTPASDVWAGVWPGVWPQGATVNVLALTAEEQNRKGDVIAGRQNQTHPASGAPGDEAAMQSAFTAHFTRDYETFIESARTAAGTELRPNGPTDQRPPAATGAGAGTRAARPSLTAGFFDSFYAAERDPWGCETRWYERRKHALTLAAVPRARFSSALELGCSIGVFTEMLVTRCDTVLAVDISVEPLRIASARLAGHPEVVFERHNIPSDWPAGQFDLIVLSEVGYYCSIADLRRLLERCRASLTPEGVLLACHWRHPVLAHPLSGDTVHAQLARVAGLQRTVHHLEYDFVLEVFEPRPARSVAQREGMVS
ncbi:MAG: class I SAM-dependent methyltransferase, partial [Cryobacterium sp.]